MCSPFRNADSPVALAKAALLLWACACASGQGVVRVCADPNNLPFSNQLEEGFENRIARELAGDIQAKLEFVWWGGHKGLVKNTLDDGRCDMLMGAPTGLESATLTQPYYRSGYMFVTRTDSPRILSLDDSRLEALRIGLPMTGPDYAPPAVALARRGLAGNVTGYRLFGADGEAGAQSRLIHAVGAGDIDVAIAWGPVAGYFARRERPRLETTPVNPQSDLTVPFVFDIAVAVRKGNEALRSALDAALRKNCMAVQRILREYDVPLLNGGGPCEISQGSSAASSR